MVDMKAQRIQLTYVENEESGVQVINSSRQLGLSFVNSKIFGRLLRG